MRSACPPRPLLTPCGTIDPCCSYTNRSYWRPDAVQGACLRCWVRLTWTSPRLTAPCGVHNGANEPSVASTKGHPASQIDLSLATASKHKTARAIARQSNQGCPVLPKKFTVAIGDIHGIAHTFHALLKELTRIYSDAEARFVFLGDLIDRGLGSFHIMQDLCALFDDRPSSVLILGNHDEFLLRCLRGEMKSADIQKWMANGGEGTLKSYAFHDDYTLAEVRKIVNAAFPGHLKLLEKAVPIFLTNHHCFVHAGVNPTKSLTEQDEHELRWIRKGFLDYEGSFEKVIVHGHTITESGFPEVYANRIALDTGSYKTGRISAAIFEDDVLAAFLCAQVVGKEVTLKWFDASVKEADGLISIGVQRSLVSASPRR
ncbi:hypothetical protein ELI26_10170 [Rhizobium ruizarguesonis]|nr:hypothetical protein ELI26_10170 [Rhizobium ruizarguesonis]